MFRSFEVGLLLWWMAFFIMKGMDYRLRSVENKARAFFASLRLPEASNFVGRRAGKVPWIYGALFSWSEMHFRLLELPFEIMLLEIRLVIFWERCSVPAAQVIRAFRRLDLTRLPEEGDFLTLRVSRGDFQKFLRSRNVRIVRWKLWEHLEILGGLILFVVWVVIYDFRLVPWAPESFNLMCREISFLVILFESMFPRSRSIGDCNQSFQVGIAISGAQGIVFDILEILAPL
ncbi:hypothetical protein F2Q68_00026013 [Brassica cretica]|uniref:Uncharacterized protein n=1 Tax=Brassica cretica TaxID=69181 RepID=A0A8S9I702_BRACR|nr:hypothetical protein F2Q68_00026013 [Brassica cretica]